MRPSVKTTKRGLKNQLIRLRERLSKRCNHEVLLIFTNRVKCQSCGKKWIQNYSDQEGILREDGGRRRKQ